MLSLATSFLSSWYKVVFLFILFSLLFSHTFHVLKLVQTGVRVSQHVAQPVAWSVARVAVCPHCLACCASVVDRQPHGVGGAELECISWTFVALACAKWIYQIKLWWQIIFNQCANERVKQATVILPSYQIVSYCPCCCNSLHGATLASNKQHENSAMRCSIRCATQTLVRTDCQIPPSFFFFIYILFYF